FYIKPQRYPVQQYHQRCCFIINFYIKPQRMLTIYMYSSGITLNIHNTKWSLTMRFTLQSY
ncbi:MAG: hypothetical protein LUC91_00165, partial [Prevotella sp.]|nr:hypothetical protein [Prevotella sp.]